MCKPGGDLPSVYLDAVCLRLTQALRRPESDLRFLRHPLHRTRCHPRTGDVEAATRRISSVLTRRRARGRRSLEFCARVGLAAGVMSFVPTRKQHHRSQASVALPNPADIRLLVSPHWIPMSKGKSPARRWRYRQCLSDPVSGVFR